MPDIADDHAAFQEAVRRAEEASGITRDADGNEVFAAEETPVVPELEGAVPVQASDQPLDPEPETPEEPVVEATSEQEQEAPAAEPTLEELQSRLATAEARLAEKDNFIGRQSSEVGELRQVVDELKQRIEAPQPQTNIAASTPVTQELIDSNPGRATQAAFAQRDEQTLKVAYEAWQEVDPISAQAWLYDRKLEQQRAEFDARLEAATAPLAQNAAEANDTRQWKEAFDEVKATRPDFLENAERLLTEVAPQYPAFTVMLQTGDAKAKADALSALYALDKMSNPAAVQQQLEEAAQEAAEEAAANRAAAGVVVGQQEAGQPTEVKTTSELEADAYKARQQNKPSLSRGWTGRS